MIDYSDEEIEKRHQLWLTLSDRKAYQESDKAYLEYMEALIGEEIQRPVSPTIPKESHLLAHVRLTKLQSWRKQRRNVRCPVTRPLSLVPHRLVRNPRAPTEALYGQSYAILTKRLLAWAMKADPEATEEFFGVVKPFALVIQLHRMADPDWHKAIPPAAKVKIIQLCVVANKLDQLKDFRKCLSSTQALTNLECIEYYAVPRLSSVSGTDTRKLSHEYAVKHGMSPGVRLFFRWAFANDSEVRPETRHKPVQGVIDVVRESTPRAAGTEPSGMFRDVTAEYVGKTWETFTQALLRPWLPPPADEAGNNSGC